MFLRMRTTVRLDENLLAEAKKYAAESGRTLTAVLEDALREALARRRGPRPRKPVRLKTVKGDGVHEGVDLDDNAALRDRMES
jgi:predicted transcriptional regulator